MAPTVARPSRAMAYKRFRLCIDQGNCILTIFTRFSLELSAEMKCIPVYRTPTRLTAFERANLLLMNVCHVRSDSMEISDLATTVK